ncbi:MAG TPA: hypothetical protein VEL76_13580 [Gemmataceae bacterium]|nr:hypothetical protein [Gemmataceae bacterium]
MGPTGLQSALRKKPFEPFRMVTSDGTCYDIRHPDLVVVTLTDAIVGFPDPAGSGAWSRFDILGLEHIVRLEQLPQPTAKPAGNGEETS